jgi:hypothetical protein
VDPARRRAVGPDGYPPEHAREVALYRTWLAEAYARNGQSDAARATLTLVGGDTGSARVVRRVGEVEHILAGRGSWT